MKYELEKKIRKNELTVFNINEMELKFLTNEYRKYKSKDLLITDILVLASKRDIEPRDALDAIRDILS